MNNHCIDCGKILSANPKAKRCISCHLKNRWRNPIIRKKNTLSVIKSWILRKKPKVKCNGCDKELFDRRSIYCEKCIRTIRFLNKNHIYCKECKREISVKAIRCKSCAAKGELNQQWLDGTSGIYPLEFSDTLKESIRNRDNHICQNCDMTEEEHLIVIGKVLAIHHINYDKNNCKKDNLITLCVQCNLRANKNRDYWIKIYKNKIKEIINVKNM